MEAYLNDSELKKNTVAAMEADIKAELLVKGHYWNGKNGCFVGCVIRGTSHAKFELQLGIPQILARLADTIFEGLNYDDAKKFSVDFLNAIPVGADLAGVWDKFVHFMLVDATAGVINFTKSERSKKAIQAVADLYARKIKGDAVKIEEWREARGNAAYADAYADAYAYAADAAADAAAYADAYADAAAAYAAYAAADAADAAAAYAADAYADAAAAAARSRHFVTLATALVSFLREASQKMAISKKSN